MSVSIRQSGFWWVELEDLSWEETELYLRFNPPVGILVG